MNKTGGVSLAPLFIITQVSLVNNCWALVQSYYVINFMTLILTTFSEH